MTRTPGQRARRLARLAATLALACVLPAGCGGSSSGSGQSITLYNGQHVQTTDSLVAGFEKATGIKVNVRSDDEDTLADEIVTEGSHSPADVVYTENSPALEYLQGKGLLAPVDPSTLAHTPSRYNSPQGDWIGVSARVSVLIYNPSLIGSSQLPSRVLQLAEPRYKGKLAFAAGETDFQPIVTSVAHTYGQAAALKWLEAIKANAAEHIYPDNETIADEVNRGAVAFGVVNQYYWYRMRAEIGVRKRTRQDRLLRPSRPRLCARHLERGDPQVLDAQGGRPEVPRLHREPRRARRSSLTRSALSIRSPRASRQPRPRPLSTSCSRTRSPFPNSATGRRRSRCCARPNCCEPFADGPRDGPFEMTRTSTAIPQAQPGGARRGTGTVTARRTPRPWGLLACSTAVAIVLVLPLAFLLFEAHGAGASSGPAAHLSPAHGHPAVEHGSAHRASSRLCAR